MRRQTLGHSRGGLAIRAAAWISSGGGQTLLWHPQLCQDPGPRVGGVLGQLRATPLSNPLPGRRDWVQRLVDDWLRGALLTSLPFLGAVCFFLSLPRAQNVAQATRPLASRSLPPRPRESAVLREMPGARLPCSLLPETPLHTAPSKSPIFPETSPQVGGNWEPMAAPRAGLSGPETLSLREEGPRPQATPGECSTSSSLVGSRLASGSLPLLLKNR